jgi:esterase/lipase/1-acyl-sn-glycerol-3-phosphate acyltransferase
MATTYQTPRPYALHSEQQHTGLHPIRRFTGISLSLIERMLASRITVTGVQKVPTTGPVLFLANHFTRFETFILPWLLDRHTKRYVHNLAHHSLFVGRFGDFLNAIGARSTKEEGIKDGIVTDLITGHHDWVIYPEGSMIKDKRVYEHGTWHLHAPDRDGPPHTGAALLALQAGLTRRRYLRAWSAQDHPTLDALEARWGFTGANLPEVEPVIVPITITYYPIRPGANLATRLARKFLKRVPGQLEEELEVEGMLLLGQTDISVAFGEPLSLSPWLNRLEEADAQDRAAGGGSAAHEAELVQAKAELTSSVMGSIYRNLEVSFDHLFAMALRLLGRDRVRCIDLHRAIYLAARSIQGARGARTHRSLGDDLVGLLLGRELPALVSIRDLAIAEGHLRVEDGCYVIDRATLQAAYGWHDVRLKNTLAVIANELEPARQAVKAVRDALHLACDRLGSAVAELLHREDRAEYERDLRLAQADPGIRPPAAVAAPVVSGPPAHAAALGVVACHGYLAAPGEMQEVAGVLAEADCRVQVVRLAGHGTSPAQLARVRRDDWRRSFDRSLAAASCTASHCVVLVGFSMGGLLALDAAARWPGLVAGVVVINLPFRLSDPASRLVPVVDAWNGVAHALHLDGLRYVQVPSSPEWPDTNYDRNPVAALHELEQLISEVAALLPRVTCPALVIQADHDPVVQASGSDAAFARLGSDDKHLVRVALDRHVIVRGPGSAAVVRSVAEFVARIRRRW